MDAVDRFAAEAARFRDWALGATDQAKRAAREALIRLTRLYLAALDLPAAWSEELADRALHCWIATNAPDRLAAEAEPSAGTDGES